MAFVVLSLPILAMLLIVTVAVLVARAVARRTQGPAKKKSIAAAIAVLVVILIPTWDEIAGRLYFHYLCATEGGVKVYKQIILPADYWNADGSQKFFPPGRNTTSPQFEHRLEYRGDVLKKYPFNITGYRDVLSERSSGNVAGTYTWFLYFGGWLANTTTLNVTAKTCHGYETTKYEDFLKHVLVPERNGK